MKVYQKQPAKSIYLLMRPNLRDEALPRLAPFARRIAYPRLLFDLIEKGKESEFSASVCLFPRQEIDNGRNN